MRTKRSTGSTSGVPRSTNRAERKPVKRTRRRETPPNVKAQVVAFLVDGLGVKEACERAGVHRQRYWDWKKGDPEFQEMLEKAGLALGQALVDEAIQRALAELRDLTPEAVDALRRGVRSNVRFQLKRVRRIELGEGGKAVAITEDWEPFPLPDSGLAVQAAERVLQRVAEFNPKTEVEHRGQIEVWIAEVDGADAQS